MIPSTNWHWNIVELAETDSTNNWLHDKFAAEMAVNGTVVRCDYQNSGRGQRGNRWLSEPAANLLFSCLIEPTELHASNQFVLLEAVALSVCDWLESVQLHPVIKWPNDIYVGEKKIAGILIENILQGAFITASIAGIGLNLNQTEFSDELPNPVSVKNITGRDYVVKDQLVFLLEFMKRRYIQAENREYETLHNNYLSRLLRLKTKGLFAQNDVLFEAVLETVEPTGEIVLQHNDGSIQRYAFKEVKHVFGRESKPDIIV
jgi:BirA family transcriptional regulator, biotin operon repressor / biotin---[acetyl-CoA-carboxylase] ligase